MREEVQAGRVLPGNRYLRKDRHCTGGQPGIGKVREQLRIQDTAWSVGYAPSDKPEIVVAALVQHGEHSAVAIPIVREVIKAYFDKKLGTKPPDNQMETQVRR